MNEEISELIKKKKELNREYDKAYDVVNEPVVDSGLLNLDTFFRQIRNNEQIDYWYREIASAWNTANTEQRSELRLSAIKIYQKLSKTNGFLENKIDNVLDMIREFAPEEYKIYINRRNAIKELYEMNVGYSKKETAIKTRLFVQKYLANLEKSPKNKEKGFDYYSDLQLYTSSDGMSIQDEMLEGLRINKKEWDLMLSNQPILLKSVVRRQAQAKESELMNSTMRSESPIKIDLPELRERYGNDLDRFFVRTDAAFENLKKLYADNPDLPELKEMLDLYEDFVRVNLNNAELADTYKLESDAQALIDSNFGPATKIMLDNQKTILTKNAELTETQNKLIKKVNDETELEKQVDVRLKIKTTAETDLDNRILEKQDKIRELTDIEIEIRRKMASGESIKPEIEKLEQPKQPRLEKPKQEEPQGKPPKNVEDLKKEKKKDKLEVRRTDLSDLE